MSPRHRRRSTWQQRLWPVLVVAVLLGFGIASALSVSSVDSPGGPGTDGIPQTLPSGHASSKTPEAMRVPAPGAGRSPSPTRSAAPRAGCPGDSGPATLTVGNGGKYPTIGAAVEAAGAGDVIEIAGGTYHEVVDIRVNRLTLRAKAGQTVTIDGWNTLPSTGSQTRGLITADNRTGVTISGLTVKNSLRHGIYAGFASNITIRNSEIADSHDGGILIGDGSGAQLECNRIHGNNSAAGGGDIGAAENEGLTLFNYSDFTITNNDVYDNDEEGIDVKNGTRNGTITGNDVYRNNGPNIYVDGASDVKISANRIYDARGSSKAGIGLAVESGGSASNVQIYNNVIWGNPGGGVDFWIGRYSNVQVFYNTIYSNGRAAIRAASGSVSDSVARDNIAYQNPLSAVSGFTLQRNVTGDPKFVDVGAGDVRLRAGSPAIDAGSNGPATDFAGVGRPVGRGPDIGAYESR
ncbi:right-handed parallel beta-helix repeat-containing protein [Cryptosporangium phraense]|uniref:Right-handed parallel beta-helix repeat-containing protein n=1 Tax=Cryptosporangium phraense TaxID=2593070 RepID=A0A545AL99_9ACTN|nr:right-handed parallel beta-helix repeat-containing protein [Cryptosporangium phraense]TQS42082.1 right-handed parallel beta-helix repeat-containing protein [Cryptosporangium phraense]